MNERLIELYCTNETGTDAALPDALASAIIAMELQDEHPIVERPGRR